jgi:hypothetical protein
VFIEIAANLESTYALAVQQQLSNIFFIFFFFIYAPINPGPALLRQPKIPFPKGSKENHSVLIEIAAILDSTYALAEQQQLSRLPT